MRDVYYCHKVKREIPLLTEEEFNSVAVHLDNRIQDLFSFMKNNRCSMWEARAKSDGGQKALAAFEKLTGVQLEHPEEIYVARIAFYGRRCPNCGKPFRTPQAKFCAECGFQLSDGETAGPL